MSKLNSFRSIHHPRQALSIRDELEKLAWIQNPRLAQRMAGRKRLAGKRRLAMKFSQGKHRHMRWQDRSLLALGTVLLAVLVIRTQSAVADEHLWGLQLDGDSGSHTELAIDTDIQIDVTGLVARVEITQQFNNSSSQWAEGIYRFPLPQGAAVDRMRVKVGKRILEGEIQEKEHARRTYEKAREAGKTTTLVEQQRRNHGD